MSVGTNVLKALQNGLEGFWTSTKYYSHGLYIELSAKHVFLWAQAIAFKVLVTVVPIVILATGIVGRVLRQQDSFAAVSRFIRELLPPSQSQQLIDFIDQLQNASGTIVGIGGVGLFLSAMSLFITLRIAVSNAFEQDWHHERSLLRGYLFDVRMVLQVGFLFLLTVGLSVFLPSPGTISDVLLSEVGQNGRWLRSLWEWLIGTTRVLLPVAITTAMFFQLYYLVPKPHPRKRSALAGSLAAAVLWEGTKQAFTYYATYVGRFERYNTAEFGHTFGIIVAFVFWVYFSGVLVMIGAVIASLREHRHVTAGKLPGTELPARVREMLKTEQNVPPHPPAPPAEESTEETVEEASRPADPSLSPESTEPSRSDG